MKGDDIADRFVGLAICIIGIVERMPDSMAGRHVAHQLLRSATSAGANYEEARGAESRRDFVHKLGVSLKEIQETHYWLRIGTQAKLVTADTAAVVAEVDALGRIIGKSRITAQSGGRKYTENREPRERGTGS